MKLPFSFTKKQNKNYLSLPRFNSPRLGSYICGGSFDTYEDSKHSAALTMALQPVSELRSCQTLRSRVYNSTSHELFNIFKFIFISNFYIRLKIITGIIVLIRLKTFLVQTLLWKRGKLARPLSHGGVVVLSVLAIVAGSFVNGSRVEAVDVTDEVLRANNTSETIIPQDRPRSEVLTYQIQPGDTASGLAEKFDVSLESIAWANNLGDPNVLKPGDVIKVPPVTGVIHTVGKGEKLEEIASKYQASSQAVVDFPFNNISDDFSLKEGQVLVIPEGKKPEEKKEAPPAPRALAQAPAPARNAGGYMWPLRARITQRASWYHPGALDIAGKYGTPILAAGSGKVIVSQKLGYGYGWHVVIDHGNGYTTLYGHMSRLSVSVGQRVNRGQVVGAEGSTGRSTGPHLHFEVRRNGAPVNPLSILP